LLPIAATPRQFLRSFILHAADLWARVANPIATLEDNFVSPLSSSMRILYHHRIASRDGQTTHIEEMVHALQQRGAEVRIVGPDVHKSDSGEGGSAGSMNWPRLVIRGWPIVV
jgi:hypothetical protein